MYPNEQKYPMNISTIKHNAVYKLCIAVAVMEVCKQLCVMYKGHYHLIDFCHLDKRFVLLVIDNFGLQTIKRVKSNAIYLHSTSQLVNKKAEF